MPQRFKLLRTHMQEIIAAVTQHLRQLMEEYFPLSHLIPSSTNLGFLLWAQQSLVQGCILFQLHQGQVIIMEMRWANSIYLATYGSGANSDIM